MSVQGSADWFAERCGRVTASRIDDVMARTKSGYGASRGNYMAQLTIERLTGEVAESFTSTDMVWGVETEPEARAECEAREGVLVIEEGFVLHPTIEQAGASPDGLIGTAGLLEIKCPKSSTHIQTIRDGKVPGKYIKQMQFQMACTGREWCDFLSYDPRLPEGLDYWLKRVERDNDLIQEIEDAVTEFLTELDEQVNELEARKV